MRERKKNVIKIDQSPLRIAFCRMPPHRQASDAAVHSATQQNRKKTHTHHTNHINPINALNILHANIRYSLRRCCIVRWAYALLVDEWLPTAMRRQFRDQRTLLKAMAFKYVMYCRCVRTCVWHHIAVWHSIAFSLLCVCVCCVVLALPSRHIRYYSCARAHTHTKSVRRVNGAQWPLSAVMLIKLQLFVRLLFLLLPFDAQTPTAKWQIYI